MDRIESLVERLNAQIAQKASLNQLLATVQMLQKEIAGNIKETAVLGASGIAVVVPNAPLPIRNFDVEADEAKPVQEKEYFELVTDNHQEETEHEEPELDEYIPQYEEIIKLTTRQKNKRNKGQSILNFGTSFDALMDVPTLAQHAKKESKSRPAEKTGSSKSHIKDLKKAINAQQRAIFIKELFRGDETMYERSIKTINNFGNLAEADYWIKRELRTKNGWLPDNPVVQAFEHLLKRRFS